MRALGVVLAGGRSSRFGSDKAAALLRGRALIDHAVAAIRPHCEQVAIVGRTSELALSLEDWPAPDMGPLGGLAAAIRHAGSNGFDQVLSIAVDCALLPADLRTLLEPAPAFLAAQPVIGLWPASAAPTIESILGSGGSHSVRAFAEAIAARPVDSVALPANINTPADLARLEQHHGL